jgi:hypothetical protein
MKTAITITTSTIRARSLCLAKYIKNIQQANERTATEYDYRLSKFEKYIAASEEQQQEQELKITIKTLDQLLMS